MTPLPAGETRMSRLWSRAFDSHPLIRAVLLVTLPILMLVLSWGSAVVVERQERQAEIQIRRAQQARAAVYTIYVAVLDVESGVRGFLLTRDEGLLASFHLAERAGPDAMRRVVDSATTPDRRERAERLQAQITARLRAWRGLVNLPGSESASLAPALLEAKRSLDEIRGTLVSMLEAETRDIAEWSAAREARRIRNRWIVGASVVGGIAGGLAIAWLFVAAVVERERLLRSRSAETRALYDQVAGLNQELERRLSEQALLNRELESFSYSVSHDLRAPLRSIDGFAQALAEDSGDRLDEKGRQHLARVRAAAQRMGMLIDEMLALSRVTRVEMRRSRVDLTAMATEILQQSGEQDPSRQVDWHVEPGLHAEGDRPLLRTVLENLLGNAWKFTSRTPAATIRVASHPAPPGSTGFVVADNGAGFDMQYAGKLFGVFQRLHTFSDFPGTGVGLATVQRIINRHGGRVWAEGTPGAGASVFVLVPAPEGEAPPQSDAS